MAKKPRQEPASPDPAQESTRVIEPPEEDPFGTPVKLTVLEAKQLGDYLEEVHGIKAAVLTASPAGSKELIFENMEPECPTLEHAGKWLAWSSDGLRILGVARKLEDAEKQAKERGEETPILQVAPGPRAK